MRAESIPQPPIEPQAFFNANGAGYARFTSDWEFVVERVIRGPMRAGDKIHFEYRGGFDAPRPPDVGTLYLVTKHCWAPQRCEAVWEKESEAPRLLAWLERSHLESHRTLLTKTIGWAEGRVPLDDYRAWLDTVIIDPLDDYDEMFMGELLESLQNLTRDLDPHTNVKAAMRDFVKLARAFPRGKTESDDVEEALLAALPH